MFAQFPLAYFAPDIHGLFLFFSAQPMTDTGLGPARTHQRQPVPARLLLRRGDYFNHIAVLQLVFQGHYLAVYLCPYAAVADLRMNVVGKIKRRAALGKLSHITVGGQGIHIRFKKFAAHRIEKFLGVLELLQPLHQLFQSPENLGILLADGLPLFISPVGRHTFLGNPIHLPGADLHLHEFTVRADNRGMHRLVVVGLRGADKILYASGHRRPVGMHHTKGLVTFGDRINNDPEGNLVIYLLQRDFLGNDFFVDRVKVFGAAYYFTICEIYLRQFVLENTDNLSDIIFTVSGGTLYPGCNIIIFIRIEILKGKILKLTFHPVNTETAGQGGIKLQGLLGQFLLALFIIKGIGANVMQPVGKLD